MDIDQLKLLLETITSLGAEGKSAFIWWLVFDKGVRLICWASLLFVVYRVSMAALVSRRTVQEFAKLRNKFGICSFGPLTDGEITRVIEHINRRIEK